MALTIVGANAAWVFGTAAVTPSAGVTPAAGDYGVINLFSKYETAALASDPAGWTDLGVAVNTGRPAGNDNGNLRSRAFGKVMTASEAFPALAPANNNVSGANAAVFRATSGQYDVQSLLLADDTPGTPLAVSGAINVQSGDKLLISMHVNGDVATLSGSPVITGGNITLTSGGGSGRYTTASGTDAQASTWAYNVTAGTTTSISFSHAFAGTTTNVAGTVHIVRIREVAGTGPAPFSGWGVPI